MNLTFLKYFFNYVLLSKTRQKLIFLTIIGLILSTFSLTVLQGVMGGLQSGLIKRSKYILGEGSIVLPNIHTNDLQFRELIQELKEQQVDYSAELELEIMVQNDNYVSPIVLHGIDYKLATPEFLKNKDSEKVILGSDIGNQLRTYFGSRLKFTSPAHTDFLFEEIPRQKIGYVSDFIITDLPELDAAHGWTSIDFVHSLIRERIYNKIIIFDKKETVLDILKNNNYSNFRFLSWEEQNSSLVWALNLETKVMIFLFSAMSLLIGICITSGFLIFYNKIKPDLASFWILGLSKKKIFKLVYIFSQSLSIFFCFAGVSLGILFLYLLDSKKMIIMPEQFIERNIPVKFDTYSILLSFFIPYIFSSLFTHYTFNIFKKDKNSFLSYIRKIG